MRSLKLVLAIAMAVAASPALAEFRAVVAANMPARGAQPDRVPDAQGAVEALGRAGFETAGGQDIAAAQVLEFLSALHPSGSTADKAVIVLAGAFVHSSRTAWLLGTDAARAGGVDLGAVAADGVDIAFVLDLAALAPQGAVVVLGEASGGPVAGVGLEAGLGPLGVLPDGVTVIRGPAAEAMAFARDDLLLRGVPLASLLARRPSLQAEGVPSRSFVFLPPGQAISDEERDWSRARAADTVAGYSDYLLSWPAGRYAAEARAALDRLGFDPVEAARQAEAALNLTRAERTAIQRDLTTLGYNTRGIDGIFGAGTRGAISAWQAAAGLPGTGYVTADQIAAIRRAATAVIAEREREDRSYWQQTGAGGGEQGLRAYLARYPNGVFAETARAELAAIALRRDREAWDRARSADTPAAYRRYLDAYPNGEHAADARRRIQQLDYTDAERLAWELALRLATIIAFEQYINAFPDGRHIPEARDRIDEIRGSADRDAWDRARARDNIGAYEWYIDQFPRGRYVGEARARIAELRNAATNTEDRAWERAAGQNTVQAYERYLRDYPRGRYAAEARARIDALSSSGRDDRAWEEARARDSVAAYRRYLEAFPRGRHAADARARIQQLEQADADARAWDRARSQDSVAAYREYLRAFPRGAFRRDAERRIAQLEAQQGGGVQPGGTEREWAQREAQLLARNNQLSQMLESRLMQKGYNPGPVDGVIDARTRAAIRTLQRDTGAPVTGYVDPAVLTILDLMEGGR
jgi:peptidoglycan hydrolase-like protein with peptidoglycan-binding domain